MKAIICFCKELSLRQFTKRQYAVFIIASTLSFTSLSAQTTITWVGAGTYTGTNTSIGQDFDNFVNWDLKRLPTSTDSVVIPFTNPGTINLSRNDTIGKLSVYLLHDNLHNLNNNNNPVYFNVGAYSLTVKGTTVIDVQDDQPNNSINLGVIDASSPGTIDFMGDVVTGSTNVRYGAGFMGNPNSTIICRGNLTLNIRAQVAKGYEPGTLLFDGTGTQNFIFNNTVYCSFNNVVIGKNNNPKVIMGGTTTPDNILGNLTINGSSILDLNTRQLNRSSVGGSLFLTNTATLRAAGLSSTSNYGLIVGSNFPSGFTNVILDSTSTVEFYGTTQSIPGAAQLIKGYGNLTLVNSTKTPSSSFAMYRNLTIAVGTTMALNNFDDTLKSNSQTTAYVSAVPASAVISYGTGGFVVERYLAAYKSWRLLATPVDTATSPTISAAWREGNSAFSSTGYGTQITGPQGPSTATSSAGLDIYTQRGSLKSYIPALNNYVEVSNANTTKIANTAGYYVFVRGDRGVAISGTTGATNLRIKGRIRTGDQSFTVPANKFASVGNPFPSKIDFRTIRNSQISPSYYVWDPSGTGLGTYNVGKYQVYVDYGDGNYRLGGSSGPIRNYIESGQAVFIQSITGGAITIKESDKFGGSRLVSRGTETQRQGVNTANLDISLMTKDANGEEVLADAAVMNFDANNNNEIDNMDVRKILNASDNLSIKKEGTNLVFESRKGLTSTDTIFLNLSNSRISNYRFDIDPSNLVYPTLKAFIKDKFLQTEAPVSLTDVTNVNFNITVDAASRATDRFMIVFKNVAPAVFTGIKAVRNNDNSVAVTWNMRNENNINTYSIGRSTDGGTNYTVINSQMPTANNFGSPYYTVTDADAPKEMVWYRIKANNISNGSFYSDKAAVKAVNVNNKHGISMYPNLVVDGKVNLYFNNQPAGKYNISIVNSKGEQVEFSTAEINNNAGLKNILIKEAAAGIYRAIVKDEKGISVAIPFVKL